MKTRRWLLSVWVLVALALPAPAQVRDIARRIGLGKPLSNEKIVAGLKEALQVGTLNTVESTGKVDGFFLNQAIKILMPEKLRAVEKGLRVAGFGSQVDEFVLSMNRAAEKAAPRAKAIFLNAILEMSFEDARRILAGNETAATQYFRGKTSAALTAAFRPVVQQAMSEAGVTRRYEEMIGKAQAIPFLKAQSLDIDEYVVSKSLDGLFHVLGEEERKIRSTPAARVTALLREVFGR